MRAPVLALLLAVAGCGGAAPTGAPSGATTPPATATPTPAPTTPVRPTTGSPTTAAPTTAAPPRTSPAAAPTTPAPRAFAYRFPIAGCRASYSRAHHHYPATDVFAAAGCAFVSPVDGRVDEVESVDRWDGATNRGADRGGLFVSVVGNDGVRYYGSHLRSIAPGIRPGVTVRAGRTLGEVGTTGSAKGTSPHLHFGVSWPSRPGVWWVRRGVVETWPYLDSWRAGGDRSPAAAVRAARREAGRDDPPCRTYC